MADCPVVYFLHRTPQNDIKVGYATKFESRISSLQNEAAQHVHGAKIVPICVVRGSRVSEQAIHRHFAAERLTGEYFSPSDRIVDYLRWMRDQHYVWVPDDEDCPSISDLAVVDASAWLPRDGERTKRLPAPAIGNQLAFDVRAISKWSFHALGLGPRILTGDDYYTAPAIITAARATMGGIDLDPASHAIANQNVGAGTFFSAADDGLARPWHGRVWLNPPFSQWARWVTKAIQEWKRGGVSSMCVLVATRTLTARYFSPMLENATAFCVLCGRIPFWGPHATSSPDDGHAILYFGPDPSLFARAFSPIGTTFFARMNYADHDDRGEDHARSGRSIPSDAAD